MEFVKQKYLSGERALFQSNGVRIEDSIFADGESPLKESQNIDINQSILSAVLPFLIATYHYDYTTAAMLVTVSNVFGAFVQPFIGMLSDKKNKLLYMTLGVLLASGGMAVTGFISNFFGLCIVVIISGIGVVMFHPQAAKLFNSVSSKNAKGKGMSIFSFGGKVGFTLGPVYTAFLMIYLG